MPYRKVSLLLAAATATLVMSITAAVGPFTLLWTNQTRTERKVVEQQLDSLRSVQSLLVDAETGQRGYALTGKEIFLQPYYIAASQLPSALKSLHLSYEGDLPDEVAKVEDLIDHVRLNLSHLDTAIKVTKDKGYDASKTEIETGQGKQLMDYVRRVSGDLIADEILEVSALDEELQGNLIWAVVISALSFIVTLLLSRFIYVSMRKAVRSQTESATAALVSSKQLEGSLEQLVRRNREIGLIAEMARLLQTELTMEETLQLASSYCQQLLIGSAGTFFLYRNSADVLQQAASWGSNSDEAAGVVDPKSCWAIRRGRWHMAAYEHDLGCSHYPATLEAEQTTHCCVPLMAYGEVLGLLYIRQVGLQDVSESGLQFVEAIAEQTALALANGRMREVLKTQSIKDPLTGLYNRRFMEETLEREIARAKRTSSCLSVIMLDLDHFKSMNDRHGHAAGDNVLRAVSALLLRSLRTTDVACRFGGEELMVILPDCPPEGAALRAEAIRASLEAMMLVELGQPFKVTASFGVASTALCGNDSNFLMKAADSALYSAKRSGRNRVESWKASTQEFKVA